MIFKNAVNILLSKFSLIYKVLLYSIIVVLFFSAIGAGVIYPILKPLLLAIDETGIFGNLNAAIQAFFVGSPAYGDAYSALSNSWDAVWLLINENISLVIGAAALVIVFILICRFMITLSNYPTSDVIFNFMNSKSKYGFTSNFIRNLKISAKFTGAHMLITVPFDLVMTLIIGLICSQIFTFSWIIALFLFTAISLLFYSLRLTLLSCWLPAIIIDGKKVFEALKFSFQIVRKKFAYLFGISYMVSLLCLSFGVLFSLSTFGVGLLFIIPIFSLLQKTMELVIYHKFMKYKYYTSYDKIVVSDVVDDAGSDILELAEKEKNQ